MLDFHSSSEKELKQLCLEKGEKPYRIDQILHWAYIKKILDLEKMTDLSQNFREILKNHVCFEHLICKKIAHDKEAIKFLWELPDQKLIESVLIFSENRRTVCVSSQVGCPARCAFCASGKKGLIRNLTAAEIIEQIYKIDLWLNEKKERVTHIVFMGMGEPLENYDEVVKAIRLLCDPKRMHFSQRKVTISTVGIVEAILKLTEEGIKPNLVLSLHAPNQRIRQKIIPYARKYSLENILKAVLEYSKKTKRDLTYEYTLIMGINDREEHAKELAHLLKEQQCTVNLIPYNSIPGIKLKRPKKEEIQNFRQILESAGIRTTWRYTKGKEIAAACGQLALQEI